MRRLLLSVLLMALFAAAHPSASAQEMPGLGETRYISPQFGYGLEWDDAWHVERSLSRPGFEALVLSNDTSQVALSATTGFAGATG